MKIRAITPIIVNADELIRRQERYNRLAPANINIRLENLPKVAETPSQLSSLKDLRASEALTLQAGNLTDDCFDALMPDCVLDPAVTALHESSDVRAIGITQLSAGFLASLGVPFGVITRNNVIGEEYAEVVKRYGLGKYFVGRYTLNLSVEDISDTELWNETVRLVAQQAYRDGVTVLINGCSAVEVSYEDLKVRIIDPTALALELLAFGNSANLFP